MGNKVYTYGLNYRTQTSDKGRKKRSKKSGRSRRKKNGLADVLTKATKAFLAVTVPGSLLFLYVLQYTAVNGHLVVIRKLENEISSLQRVNDNIAIEVKRLSTISRITSIAEKKLGLTPPSSSPVIFYVDADKLQEEREKDAKYSR